MSNKDKLECWVIINGERVAKMQSVEFSPSHIENCGAIEGVDEYTSKHSMDEETD
ncbi:hypothetical protein 015DV002_94 [Bacillus phage 015DV002]|nr:hypothetical protein 015DV002_94 [Bacillus phage 015DV002]